jgi:hypothetical protein
VDVALARVIGHLFLRSVLVASSRVMYEPIANINNSCNSLLHNYSRSKSEPRKPAGPRNHLRQINPQVIIQKTSATTCFPNDRNRPAVSLKLSALA